jgi:hypothetical protein
MNRLLHKTLLLLFTAVMITSCNEGMQTVKVAGRYSLELPSDYKKVNDINEEASLQYQNTIKNIFIIVIDEPKTALAKALSENSLNDSYTNDLEGYSRLITNGMDASISVKNMPDFEDTTINGFKARLLSFDGLSSGNRVYWKLAFVEGNNRYYQIMVWTNADNQKKYENEMAAIINSFKETDKSK